jgi:hypothetical protein
MITVASSSALVRVDSDQARQADETISGHPHQSQVFWQQVAGAPYSDTKTILDSGTPFSADLYAVRLRNSREALAGGAACKDENVAPDDVPGCERVPVIYGTDPDHSWHEVYRSADSGYVGAIAWIGKGKALAVGGSGTYPKREPNPTGAQWDYATRVQNDRDHGAGDARAWYFHDGSWHDISDELPPQMSGLTALDIWIGKEPDGSEWGLAGDYGHIWEWRGGRFTGKEIDQSSPSTGGDAQWSIVNGPTSFSSTGTGTPGSPVVWSPSPETSSASSFIYRVREIRIAPDRTQKRAFAFTVGCCGTAADRSRRIEYIPNPKKNQAGVAPDQNPPPPDQRPRWIVSGTNPNAPSTNTDKQYGDSVNDSVYSFALKPSHFQNPAGNKNDEFGEPEPKEGAPVWNAGDTVVAPGGPDQGSSTPATASPPRYTASDGDTEVVQGAHGYQSLGNGTPDWEVGTEPADPGKGSGRGLIMTTVQALKQTYGGLRPDCGRWWEHLDLTPEGGGTWPAPLNTMVVDPEVAPSIPPSCRLQQVQAGQAPKPDSDGPIETRETGIQAGPTWSLNAINMRDSENIGYAVGDRGAIMRFGHPPVEPDPPTLGKAAPARLADDSPYAGVKPPAAGSVAAVPSLASQPRLRAADPQLVAAGSPDGNQIGSDQPVEDAAQIVMSRDGSEGWAIGPTPEGRVSGGGSGGVMTLYHYREGQWRRCDPVGVPGLLEADPACASLASIYKRDGADKVDQNGYIRLDAAARMPFENDTNPANDDEFEVIAVGGAREAIPIIDPVIHITVGTVYVPTVIVYRDGRWRLGDAAMRRSLAAETGQGASSKTATSMACLAPDECWLAEHGAGSDSTTVLRRFDGTRWIDCTPPKGTAQGAGVADTTLANSAACGDTPKLLASLDYNAQGSNPGIIVAAAGSRVYLAGTRRSTSGSAGVAVGSVPVGGAPTFIHTETLTAIFYKDHGDGAWQNGAGAYDPGKSDSNAAPAGAIKALTVTKRDDGRYEGWAVATGSLGIPTQAKWPLLHLDPASGEWSEWNVRDAAYDLIGPNVNNRGFSATLPGRIVALPGSRDSLGRAYLSNHVNTSNPTGAMLAFNPSRNRWEVAEHPGPSLLNDNAPVRPIAVAADGTGGAWATFETASEPVLAGGNSETYFYDYTTAPPKPVFDEVAQPLRPSETLTDLAGSAEGSIWISTDQGSLYRRDRATGWQRIAAIPGWDFGRIATRRSPIASLALGPDGAGIAVGERGRLADISPSAVGLDPASGRLCRDNPPPCGTSFDLKSAAVAQDGSGAAMAGGEKLALMWRPSAGGDFRRLDPPDATPTATITGISMPDAGHAWLSLNSGQVYAATLASGWNWRLENTVEINGQNRLTTEDAGGNPIALDDIAVDESGHGFAVGQHGVVIERSGGSEPWRRVKSGVTEELTSVALPAGQGSGALIGGEDGLVLTLADGSWRLARPGDQLYPDHGQIAGLALLGGPKNGQVEAWAGVGSGSAQLLHYTNAPDEPLLGGRDAQALADAPPHRDGEISFAAFGRSDCHLDPSSDNTPCPPLANGTDPNQLVLRDVRNALVDESKQAGGPSFSIFTGDAYDSVGPSGYEPVEQNSRLAAATAAEEVPSPLRGGWTGGEKLRRFNDEVTDYLPDHGLPLFAPIGARDLSEVRQCAIYACADNKDRARAGENLAWRQAMAGAPAGWGAGPEARSERASFVPVPDGANAMRLKDQQLDDPSGVGLDPVKAPSGGASTHYALDMIAGGRKVARLVFADTSLGALSAADPIQQPLEPDGGQISWLNRVLCVKGSSADTGQCTRDPDQQAIVIANAPTYSYGPTDPTQTETDGTLFESIMLQNHVNAVVAGKLGWNGRYWLLAPGLHLPCPGGAYIPDREAPKPGTIPSCGVISTGAVDTGQTVGDAQSKVLAAAGQLGGAGAIPFVVASGAGGRFDQLAQGGQATAANGFWQGYTIVRLDPSGDPTKTIVEQRPILDWVGIEGERNLLRPGTSLNLDGVGREPIGASDAPRFDSLDTPAITHCYDLVLADPAKPWLPLLADEASASDKSKGGGKGCRSRSFDSAASGDLAQDDGAGASGAGNACAPYICLSSSVGTINDTTGAVKAGAGDQPRTFAIALLSVGSQSATYPLVFEPRPSFRQAPPPPPTSLPPASVPPPAPQPPAPAPPFNPPTLASPPPLTALPTQTPPVPPAPPPPPNGGPAQLDLFTSPPVLSVSPTVSLFPPSAPVINVAPPTPARPIEKAKKVAVQSSGSDSDAAQKSEIQESGGDLAVGRDSPAFSRHDPNAFTAIAHRDQASAWARDLQWGGGLTLMALVAAFGWITVRPTPRRREPEVPSPAWNERRR